MLLQSKKFQRLRSDLQQLQVYWNNFGEQNVIWWTKYGQHNLWMLSSYSQTNVENTGKTHFTIFVMHHEIFFKSLPKLQTQPLVRECGVVSGQRGWQISAAIFLHSHSTSLCFPQVRIKPFSREFTSHKTALFSYEVTTSSPWLQQGLIKASIRFISRGIASYV